MNIGFAEADNSRQRELLLQSFSREELIGALFRELDRDGDERLASCEMLPVAEFVGFEGSQLAWHAEYNILCEYLRCDPRNGVELAAFISLVSDSTAQGCFLDDASLAELLAGLRQLRGGGLDEAQHSPKAKLRL